MNLKVYIYLLILVVTVFACKDDEEIIGIKNLVLTTEDAKESSDSSITLYAHLEINDSEISSAGFEYGTKPGLNEQITSVLIQGKPTGNFKYNIKKGLIKDSTYYYRAFVISNNKVYGKIKSIKFTGNQSNGDSLKFVLTTGDAKESSDGTITLFALLDVKKSEISSAGFEYGTKPDLKEQITSVLIQGKPTGNFEYNITKGLIRDSTYFYRAFVISNDKVYGKIKSITFTGYSPTIYSLSENSGQIGDTLVIYGKHFVDSNKQTLIDFSGTIALPFSLNDSTIKCIVPFNLSILSSEIKIKIDQRSSNLTPFFLYTPVITNISPDFGFDGTKVKITGEHFSKNPKFNEVSLNGFSVKLLSSTENEIEFEIPQMQFYGVTPIGIKVGKQSIKSTKLFNLKGPVITNLSANEGHSGDPIVIYGENFTQNGNSTNLLFGGYQVEIKSIDSVSISFDVPVNSTKLLENYTASIKITNGSKSVTFPSFSIQKSWETKSAPPFGWGWMYKAFTYNNKSYIWEINTLYFYCYDPITNTWTTDSLFPGERDENNLFIVNGNTLYKMGGINHLGPVSVFWQYNFDTKLWKENQKLPFTFNNASYFDLGDKAIIVTDKEQVWSFEYASGKFTQLNNFPGTFDRFGFTFKNNGDLYLITYGTNWQYNSVSDTWTEKSGNSLFKSYYGNDAFGFYANNKAYVLENGETLYRFNPETLDWKAVSKMPGCGNENSYKTPFVIDGIAYIAVVSGHLSGCYPFLFSYKD